MNLKIETFIIFLYFSNIILFAKYNLHMFQLNSYKTKKHFKWIQTNIVNIIYKTLPVFLGVLVLSINKDLYLITIMLALINIICNGENKKVKIKLKITQRVQRQIFTIVLIIIGLILIPIFDDSIKIGIIYILIPLIVVFANICNLPIEKLLQKYYINSAKKILEQHKNLIIIGITGSYGKTSFKNYLYSVLSQKYDVLITPKNYNTTLGVVKTIREELKATHQIFICEMGATKLNDIKEICDIVKPKYGVITSIGPQHLESFKSIENIIKTKFELADSVMENGGKVFLNCSNEYILKQAEKYECIKYGAGSDDNIDYNAYDISADEKGVHFSVDNFDERFTTEVLGKHNCVNLAGAIAVADYFKVPHKEIVKQVKTIKGVEHRLQLIKNGEFLIIDDSYNSNPVSSKSAIDTLSEFKGIKILVTPGLIELGSEENKYNFELGKYAAGKCDYIFLVGKNHSKPIYEGIKSTDFDMKKVHVVDSPEQAVNEVKMMNLQGIKIILLENDLPDNYN